MSRFDRPLTVRPLPPGFGYLWAVTITSLTLVCIAGSALPRGPDVALVTIVLAAFVPAYRNLQRWKDVMITIDTSGRVDLHDPVARTPAAPAEPRVTEVEAMPGLVFFGGKNTWFAVLLARLTHNDRVRLRARLPLR